MLALTALPLLIFLDKPFHIDDVYFIEVAENILLNPLQPFAGAAGLEDIDYRVFERAGLPPQTFSSMSHPPLVPYALALVRWAAGEWSEAWAHLAFLPFALGAALALHGLASRFTHHPLAATLFVVWSPPFFLAAQSVMTDVPALCLSLGSLALLARGIERERRLEALAAGLLMGLALVTRYSTLLMLPLLLGYGWSRRRARFALLVLPGAALVTAAWCAQNAIVHGELHVLSSVEHFRRFYAGQSFDWNGVIKKTTGDASALGGTMAVAGLLCLVAARWRGVVVFGTSAAAAALVFVVRPEGIERLDSYSSFEAATVAGFVGLAGVLVVEALAAARASIGDGDRDSVFLAVWLIASLWAAVLLLPFGAARYLLPALPPLAMLLARRLPGDLPPRRGPRLAVVACLSQLTSLSLLLGVADRELARAYRDIVAAVAAEHRPASLWFVGEWGFRHYAHAAGGRYLRSDDASSPRLGDIVLRPEIAGMHEIAADLRRRTSLLRDLRLPAYWPVRLMSFEAKAGFYSHHWGYRPFSLVPSPLERFEVLVVRESGSPAGPDASEGRPVRAPTAAPRQPAAGGRAWRR